MDTILEKLEKTHFYKYDYNNFIDLVDMQNPEITYSNLFQYIFQSSVELFQKFAEEVLEINNLSAEINVSREESHIDLLVTDKNNVIVIENKIKSDINGLKYEVQDSELVNKFGNKVKHFFIFTPDYNDIDTSKIQYLPQGTYTSIPYSNIFEFYDKYQEEYRDKIFYYNEFLYAIEKLAKKVNSNIESK